MENAEYVSASFIPEAILLNSPLCTKARASGRNVPSLVTKLDVNLLALRQTNPSDRLGTVAKTVKTNRSPNFMMMTSVGQTIFFLLLSRALSRCYLLHLQSKRLF